MKKSYRGCIFPALVALALLAGCSKSEPKKVTSQVAAKVNSTEITISQINSVLSRTPNVTPDNTERIKREILEKLIDAELAKEAAVANKLDRSPAVVQALESAKTEVLARSYVEQFSGQQPKPTAEEVKKYYIENPDFFTRRRVFNVEEIAMPAAEGLAARLRAQIPKTRSMTELASWLRAQGIEFSANAGVRFTEQIPAEYQQQMQTMKDGEMRLFENGGALLVVHAIATKLAPVDEAHAAPRVQQYLFTQRFNAALATDIKQLREKAKLEYVGEFASSAAEAQANAKAEAAAKAKATAESRAKADVEARAKTDQIAAARAAAEAKAKEDSAAQATTDEAARARRAAEAKARAAAEDARKGGGQAAPVRPDIEKGVSGLIK